MGVEKHQMTAAHNNDAAVRCLNKSHSVDLYRPPALRNHSISIDETIIPTNIVATDMMELTNATTTSRSPSADMSAVANGTDEYNAANENEQQRSYRQQNDLNDFNAITAAAAATTTIMTSANNTEKPMATTQLQQQQRSQTTTATTATTMRRERRPDRAVYVPRAVRRSQTTPPAVATTAVPTASSPTTTTSAAAAFTTNQQQLPFTSVDQTALVANAAPDKPDVNSASSITSTLSNVKAKKSKSSSNNGSGSGIHKERKERNKKSINSDTNIGIGTTTEAKEFPNNSDQPLSSTVIVNINTKDLKPHETRTSFSSSSSIVSTTTTTTNQNDISNCDNDSDNTIPQQSTQSSSSDTDQFISSSGIVADHHQFNNTSNITMGRKNSSKSSPTKKPTAVNAIRIEYVASNASKCDNDDEQELQRASKEINRSNRRIMKQTFVSDVLEIPETIDNDLLSDRKILEGGFASNAVCVAASLQAAAGAGAGSSTTDEEEEDDWESMFDETGECLDPKIIQELTASVGKVKIELPKMDYTAYLSKQAILNDEEFPHVLEVSNFPTEFKTPDLLMVFSQYKESGFDIKWVDDTHALAVFSSSSIAAEVLTMGHPFVVLKPLALATVESRLKAKKCATSLQPYKQRPETCAALARRLVTGALGVRLKTAAAERENEKRVLREAKERKLLAAKQRDEAWES